MKMVCVGFMVELLLICSCENPSKEAQLIACFGKQMGKISCTNSVNFKFERVIALFK